MTEEDKAYVHWLYQAVGMGNRGLLRGLEEIGTPREIYQMAVSGNLKEKVSKRYHNKITHVSESAADYDVQGEYERMRAQGIWPADLVRNWPRQTFRLSAVWPGELMV